VSVGGSVLCEGGNGGQTVEGGSSAQGGFGGDGADGRVWIDSSNVVISGTVSPAYGVP
jgi:hypothetical protein